jgi:hypothetical protein
MQVSALIESGPAAKKPGSPSLGWIASTGQTSRQTLHSEPAQASVMT